MSRAYNINLISTILCYTPEEICALFSEQKLHVQTVRSWTRKGLPILCTGSPVLIDGVELKKFLTSRNDSHKVETNFDEMFCFHCHVSHIPLGRRISISQNEKSIRACGLCPNTKKPMYKNYKMDDYGQIASFFNVVPESRLYDSEHSPCSTHFLNNSETPEKEQPNLFNIQRGK